MTKSLPLDYSLNIKKGIVQVKLISVPLVFVFAEKEKNSLPFEDGQDI